MAARYQREHRDIQSMGRAPRAAAPAAFIGMLQARNFGRRLVKLV
jgi:NADPH-dependent curcumin reductase CurA